MKFLIIFGSIIAVVGLCAACCYCLAKSSAPDNQQYGQGTYNSNGYVNPAPLPMPISGPGYTGGYTPNNGGFATNNGGFAPNNVVNGGANWNNANQGWNPNQGGWNANQGGYNPNQGGYNPNEGGYNQGPTYFKETQNPGETELIKNEQQ